MSDFISPIVFGIMFGNAAFLSFLVLDLLSLVDSDSVFGGACTSGSLILGLRLTVGLDSSFFC